jgi:hypothetical protein
MPENTENPAEFTDKQKELLSQTMGIFLDMAVQVIAVQFALVDAGHLTFEKVQEHVDLLNKIPSIVQGRTAFGAHSGVIDTLLASYKGRIQ